MKAISYPQFCIVEGDTAKELTEALNRIVMELKDKNPQVEFFDSCSARIAYTETVNNIPEELSDEYHLKGVNLFCDDCPYFERAKKRDGSEDLRKNFGTCPFEGMQHKRHHACDKLFEMINSGAIKLCLAT